MRCIILTIMLNIVIIVIVEANDIIDEKNSNSSKKDSSTDSSTSTRSNSSSSSSLSSLLAKKQQQRGISFYIPDGGGGGGAHTGPRVAKKPVIKYSCTGKEDEGHYEHSDCKKYWQCLYVGTIFETAVERKCPVGTMFHPIERVCEISTMVGLIFCFFDGFLNF